MPSLSMGQTMNHVAAVVIPITGGLLWNRFGYHAPFWCGVGAAIVSLLITQAVLPRFGNDRCAAIYWGRATGRI